MRFFKGLLSGGALLSLSALTVFPGCATYKAETSPNFPAASAPELVLKPGDSVQVLYTFWPDLDVAQQIRPDGKIALKMVGEVAAGGKTPGQLREELHTVYADKIKDPDISVVVAGLGTNHVFVGGEVLQPGMIPITGPLTLLEAVMQAGGPSKASARLRDVILVREKDGVRYTRTVDLRESFNQPESESIPLQPYDVIFVPRTAIDRVDQFVEQYINGIVPRNFQATYVWSNPQGAEIQRSRSTNVNLGPFTQPIN
jgi:protein involved in polysaccharide export with SLBB domain